MKIPSLVTALVLLVVPALAQTSFPGLKTLLTEAEWKRAGLDRLSPDQIGVIDAALIRHQAGVASQHQAEITTVREVAATASAAEKPRGVLERFGLPAFNDSDWRNTPPLKAKVVKWESANRFRLDNGQVWEGVEPIVYNLLNKDIEIQARPHEQFALSVDGSNTTIRVLRIR